MSNTRLEWSGKSVFHRGGAHRQQGSFHLNMLAEDAGRKIGSQWSGRTNGNEGESHGLTLEFQPSDERLAALTTSCIQHRYHVDLTSSLTEFARIIAHEIIVANSIVYELQLGRDPQTKQVHKATLRHVVVPNDSVFAIGNTALQNVPTSLARQSGSQRFVLLEPQNTFVFRAPLQWRSCLRRIRYASKVYNKLEHGFREDVLKALENQKDRIPSTGNHGSRLEMLARSIAPIGWYGRGTFSEYIADYQLVEWQIRWETFCRDLGMSILRQVARASGRIAEQIDSESRLRWNVTPDAGWTADLRHKLRRGEMSFVDALELLN